MAVRIRLSRAGAKKTPHYRVIVADSRSPRDGRFLERVGTYHPLLPRDHPDRVKLKVERIKYWLEKGAKPSGKVSKFLGAEDLVLVTKGNNPQKAKPKAKAQARLDELAKASEEAKASENSEDSKEAASEVSEETTGAPEAEAESGSGASEDSKEAASEVSEETTGASETESDKSEG